jgi:SpoVK/Ycf46/Vps4 family AAA+-type ATPase
MLAHKLGFELITVTPSDFAAGGGEAVEARSKAIFRVLEEQRDVVVLFDEIDHLLLDRDSDLYRTQSDIFQLLTPGMLTKLARLADQRTVIFVVATNYFEQIDPAIRRVGRIDSRYLVLPPNMEQRKAGMRNKVDNFAELDPQLQDQLATATLFFTYRELDELGRQLRRRHKGVDGEALVAAGITAVSRSPALLNLHMYDERLRKMTGARERPLEEFALVAYLELETHAGHFRGASESLHAEAIKDALEQRLISDDTVAALLKTAVAEHHADLFEQ